MALIRCPDCKREISDLADKCPHCSYPNLLVDSHSFRRSGDQIGVRILGRTFSSNQVIATGAIGAIVIYAGVGNLADYLIPAKTSQAVEQSDQPSSESSEKPTGMSLADRQDEVGKARLAREKAEPKQSIADHPGYYVTASGFLASSSKGELETVSQMLGSNDNDAVQGELDRGAVIWLPKGLKLDQVDSADFLGSLVKIRVRGTNKTLWTFREALN